MSSLHPTKEAYAVHPHITSIRAYMLVFTVLIVFTVLTVAVSLVHLGPLNLIVAIVIATMKAALVVLYFMHVKYETKFNALVFLGSLLFGGVFLAYTMNDTEHRGQVDEFNGSSYDPVTGKRAYGTSPRVVEFDELKKKQNEPEKQNEPSHK